MDVGLLNVRPGALVILILGFIFNMKMANLPIEKDSGNDAETLPQLLATRRRYFMCAVMCVSRCTAEFHKRFATDAVFCDP